MIVGKDSWKVLVIGVIVMTITGICGGMCMAGHKGVDIGLINIAFGLLVTYLTYKYFEKKSKAMQKSK